MITGVCHCGRTWASLRQSHCVQCHEHFSTVRNFDRHQRRISGAVICLAPARVGLIPHAGSHGITWRESGAGRPPWRRGT